MKRPSVPRRLRGAHPRRADGRFMSRASAQRVITRITRERQQHEQRESRKAKRRRVYKLTREREPKPSPASKKRKRPPPDEPTEYAVSADYKKTRRGSAVSVQLAIFADKPATHDELRGAIHDKLTTGDDRPGFRVRIVDWKGRNKAIDQDKDWRAFTPALFSSKLDIRKDREN